MQQPYLELRTRRELGTILSDAFTLIRINRVPLFKVLLKTTGVFFLLSTLLSGLYQYANYSYWITTAPFSFVAVFFLMMLGAVLFFVSSAAAVFAFMQNYITTRGSVQEETIMRTSWANMGQLFLIILICYPVLLIGFLLFFIPGVYLLIPIALVFPVFCFQGLGKIDSIKAAFRLISGYWWVTFGTILVISIIIGIISFVFQIPGMIYLGGRTFFAISGGNDFSGDFIYLLLATLGSAASNLISIIMTVCLGLIYFDLDEEKNRTGLKAKLEDLG